METPARYRLLIAALIAIVHGSILRFGVLCLGDDGHVQIESALASCCAEDAPGEIRGGAFAGGSSGENDSVRDASPEQAPCGPCTDLPLSAAADFKLQLKGRTDAPIGASPPAGLPDLLDFSLTSARSALPRVSTPLRSTRLDILRATILRC